MQGIGTFAGVLAVIAGAKIGSNAWRDQKRAERRLEMAEQIVTATYNARLALERIRAVMMWGYELSRAEEKLKESKEFAKNTPGRQKRLITVQAFYNRIENYKAEELALDKCLPMSRAMFNVELEEAIRGLSHQFWFIYVDLDFYIDDELEIDQEMSKKVRRVMYNIHTKDEPNEMTERINSLIATIESQCIPALRLESAHQSRSVVIDKKAASE